MTDMPEKIWVIKGADDPVLEFTAMRDREYSHATEFVRADIHEAKIKELEGDLCICRLSLEAKHTCIINSENENLRAKLEAAVDGLLTGIKALKAASRMLSDEHRVILRGNKWGGSDIKKMEETLTKLGEK